jgi:DNA-binding LacI/PurR family transcriptional regulator
MAALLDREPDIDAVFVPSDQMALGALRAIRDTGRRAPDDGDPPLTTVHQPVVGMGRELARTLLSQPASRPADRAEPSR